MDLPLSRTARATTTNTIRDLLDQARRPGMLSLAGGLPDPATFPAAELAELAADAIGTRGTDVLQYGPTAGDAALREWIAATTPAAASAEAVIVTTGSQQALHLLAQVLVDPGDTVVVGDPEYLGALQAFRSRAAHLAPVPVDDRGLDVDHLARALQAGLRPSAVYLVPRYHNPTGAELDPARRTRLLELADHHRFLVVEDDPYRDLALDDRPAPEPDPHPRLVLVRSTSKVLAPGLRVGWLIGPRALVAAVERAKQAADLHTSGLGQAMVLAALAADWFPRHLERLRADGRLRRDALVAALRRHGPADLRFREPAGGMFVWARFGDGTDTAALLPAALDRGVAFVPGAAFAVQRPLDDHLRLSWATCPPAEIDEAVTRLFAARAAPTTGRARRRSTPLPAS